MFSSLSSSSSKHPRAALLNAHLQSSITLAIYLIVGCALAALSLIGVAYSDQLHASQTWLPYASMLSMVLWFTLGTWVINYKQCKVNDSHRTYSADVQCHAIAPLERPTVEPLTLDEPWELHAFWGAQPTTSQKQDAAASKLHSQPSWSYSNIPASAQIPRAIPVSTAASRRASSPLLDLEVIATIEGNRPLRPISLFGSVQ